MQEFSMRMLKGQGSSEMQTKAHTTLKLLLLGQRLLDLRHLHFKMLQLQLQVSISFVYLMMLLITINHS